MGRKVLVLSAFGFALGGTFACDAVLDSSAYKVGAAAGPVE